MRSPNLSGVFRRCVIFAALILLIGCVNNDRNAPRADQTPTTTTASSSTKPASRAISWTPCEEDPDLYCGTLTVPLDWSDPQGGTIELAVARRPASGRKRIGTLFTNPGGPGASGVDFLLDDPLSPELLERFDLVSWDPRGVGRSAPLECGDAVEPFLRLDPDPDTPEEQSALDNAARAVAEECRPEAEMLTHMGTDATVRDLDALRQAVGDERLTYLGFSYGTFIGLRYLDTFPERVRAIVLDGVVDPTQSLTTFLRGQLEGMTAAIDRAFDTCTPRNGCRLTDPAATYREVKERAEAEPLPAQSGTMGPAELATGSIYATYDPLGWPALLQALQAASRGDGTAMVGLAEMYWDIADWTAYSAITCLDWGGPTGGEAYRRFADEMRAFSPEFGGSVANEMLPCAYWPVPARPITGPVRGEGSPPILVVGTTGDAATPYRNAIAVTEMLADGHLVTYRGEGHTAYGRDPCIDATIHAYLIDLDVPSEDPNCGAGSGSDLLSFAADRSPLIVTNQLQ